MNKPMHRVVDLHVMYMYNQFSWHGYFFKNAVCCLTRHAAFSAQFERPKKMMKMRTRKTRWANDTFLAASQRIQPHPLYMCSVCSAYIM